MSDPHVKIAAIVAMARNRVIGRDNDLPWHIPDDLKRFKVLSMGKPVIMGRKTYESIIARLGKPLPNRISVVVTRQDYSAAEGVIVCHDLAAAIGAARSVALDKGCDEIIIAGGAQIFEQALPVTERIYLTVVHDDIEGDTFFPKLEPHQWRESAREDKSDPVSYSFMTLDRVET